MPFFKTTLVDPNGSNFTLDDNEIIDEVLTIYYDDGSDGERVAVDPQSVYVSKALGEVFSYAKDPFCFGYVVECTKTFVSSEEEKVPDAAWMVASALPEPSRSIVLQALDEGRLALKRHGYMTQLAREIQRQHLGDHNGDVYHAMQFLCVKTGLKRVHESMVIAFSEKGPKDGK